MSNIKLNIEDFYKKLDALFAEKNLQVTTEFLEDTLKNVTESDDKYGIIAVSNELGGLCRVTGKSDRAKELYQNIFSILGELNMIGTLQYATAMINLGDVYIITGEKNSALEYFLKAENILTACAAGDSYQMAALCNNISMIYRQTEDFEKAEEALKKSFKIIETMPQCRAELATTHVNLGELQVKRRNLGEAAINFKSAMEIYENETDSLDVHYSSAVAGLGEVSYLQGNSEKALDYYNKALMLIERDFGKAPSYNTIKKNIDMIKAQI